jgi:hypothetical protein
MEHVREEVKADQGIARALLDHRLEYFRLNRLKPSLQLPFVNKALGPFSTHSFSLDRVLGVYNPDHFADFVHV